MLSMFIAKNAAKTGCKSALSYFMTELLKNILPKKVVFAFSHSVTLNKSCHSEFISESLTDYRETLKQVQGDKKAAFSLVELLMALLVASLLMAALAPVMTRRIGETLNINGSIDPKGTPKKIEIDFNSNSNKQGEIFNCQNIITEADGSKYCEGEFVVPNGYNGIMKVIVIGAGGGGGTAPTAGYTEYTTVSNAHQFTVPSMVNKAEVTLVSGGAGGAAGGQLKTDVMYNKAPGEYTWNVPDIAKNRYAIITACGGGGGGGGFGQGANSTVFRSMTNAGNGGHGGYIKKAVAIGNASTQNVIIGGGGGGGAAAGETTNAALNGTGGAGGGGGADSWDEAGGTGGRGGRNGGTGGKARGGQSYFGLGGERGDTSLSTNGDGQNGVLGSKSLGGTGGGSGNGGEVGWVDFRNSAGVEISHGQGAGGGGGSTTGYGGGGGGGACGGSGGGGGGGATIFGTRNNILAIAPGGGGGGGAAIDDAIYENGLFTGRSPLSDYETSGIGDNVKARRHGGGGAGGGGGGMGGGGGGRAGRANVNHATAGANGLGYSATDIEEAFGPGFCTGGIAYHNYTPEFTRYRQKGESGKQGAMKITYLDYGPGGSGGGGGQIVPIRQVSVKPNETLTIKVGSGGIGGRTGKINADGTITKPERGEGAQDNEDTLISKLFRGSTLLLTTAYINNAMGAHGGDSSGQVYSWDSSPWYGARGGVNSGSTTQRDLITVNGFTSGDGHTANNGTTRGNIIFAAKTTGGDGGNTKLFNLENHCTVGKGGTSTSINGTNATGYGGCGGGGGFAFGNGGSGVGGYARLAWNMYWNSALNGGSGDYEYANIGSGGGGASGNVMTHTVSVISGQTIRIRIGQGGAGARVENNNVIAAVRGGDTVFGDSTFGEIKAGGGGGGISPSVNAFGVFTNGKGGSISNVCHYKSKGYLNNTNYCLKGKAGNTPLENSSVGGDGANFSFEKIFGTGGAGGRQDTGENSNGGAGGGIGAGGGGAAIRKFSNGVSASDVLNNPNKGGQGSNGKIIIEWWE